MRHSLVIRSVGLSALLCLAACGGATTATDGTTTGTKASATCSASDQVSMGQATADDSDCTTIAVFENLQSVTDLASTTRVVAEAIATGLDSTLTRANVVTSDDENAAAAYEQLVTLVGGDPTNLATSVASSFSSADILVVPVISGDLNATVVMNLVAINVSTSSNIGSVSFTGTATELGQQAVALGTALADKIKTARVCLKLTPVTAVIDFEDASKRTETFTATVKDLENQGLDSGTVDFSLDHTDWGTLSASSASLSGGIATTVFTMTVRQPNALTASYTGPATTQTAKSTIIPLCGWILTIDGSKTFSLNQASPPLVQALLGDGAWVTLNGTDTVTGRVSLTIIDTDSTVYGTGDMTETENTTGGSYVPVHSVEDGSVIGQCTTSGIVTTGTATGGWVVWGSATSREATISGLATGSSASGTSGFGACVGGGLTGSASASGGFTVLSEFNDVNIALTDGATATAAGNGSLLQEPYSYTLTLKRAAP